MIRGQSDVEEKFHYICRNPWDSGVAPMTQNYPWLWPGEHVQPDVGPGEHTRPRVSPSAPSPMASVHPGDAAAGHAVGEGTGGGQAGACTVPTAGAQSAAREGACAPPEQVAIDIAFRVIADHIRTLSFAIADGIQPGNNDRNYVLRRILRRAVRYGRTLGFHEPFFYQLVAVLADTMGDVFPEIRAKRKHVEDVIRTEEEAFNKTLDTGIAKFNEICAGVVARSLSIGTGTPGEEAVLNLEFYLAHREQDFPAIIDAAKRREPGWDPSRLGPIPGEDAFKLYDTYGFPLDLTELMARECPLTVDTAGFNKLMEAQRARARAAQKKTVIELSQIETQTPTAFVGYDNLETPAKVLEVVQIKDQTAVILDTSACYAEMGGQVGDTGELFVAADVSPRQSATPAAPSAALLRAQPRWQVANTQKSGNTWLHLLAGEDAPAPGDAVTLAVNRPRRAAIQRHHTVTHLLHWALHEVVSREASQKGSFVGPDKLTFDFNAAPLTPEQVADVEKLVNERILENAGVSWTEVKYSHIKERRDIMQFFGDKYGEWVRVVQIGGQATGLDGYSMELCGGTHTRATGEIGLFRIVSETAIAAGVRRIEAIAGLEAWRRAGEELAMLKTVGGRLATPLMDLDKKVENLLAHQRELEKQLKAMQQKDAAGAAKALLAKAQTVNGTPALIERFDADGDTFQGMVNELKGQFEGVILLGGVANGAVALIASVSAGHTAKVQAGKLIQALAPIVGGKGGGRPDNARGGGKDVAKLDEALAKARSLIG
jgi:alanyl-tRNA synthetase